jgi:hypothetical protein
VPAQVNPVSIAQSAEQPSPETTLLSSHCSVPAFLPSPHTGVQCEGEPKQTKPGSTAHSGEQPSPETLLLSSQRSGPTMRPSPQTVMQALLPPVCPMQVQPVSTPQTGLHPS